MGWRWGSQNSYFLPQLCSMGTMTLLSPLHQAQLPRRISALLPPWGSGSVGEQHGADGASRCTAAVPRVPGSAAAMGRAEDQVCCE